MKQSGTIGNPSQKIKFFVFGISLGLVVGCLFFIFQPDGMFAKSSEAKPNLLSTLVDSADESAKKSTQAQHEEKLPEQGKIVRFMPDSEASTTPPKSATIYNDEDIDVLKEELVGVKNLYLKNLDAASEHKSISDSTLTAMSGISPNKKDEFFMIEFWKTPLNSKGYKMTRSRVLIYGVKENENVSLVKMNDAYYLKNNTDVYKLSYSPDFKPMEKISENSILQKLN